MLTASTVTVTGQTGFTLAEAEAEPEAEVEEESDLFFENSCKNIMGLVMYT